MDKEKKTSQNGSKKHIFLWFIVIYAGVILLAMAIGFNILYGFLRGYEHSLPYHTTDTYLEELTIDHICSKADDILDQIDTSVQTSEEALAQMKQALSDPITFYKSIRVSTDDKLVYILRCGNKTIGSFEIEPTPEGSQSSNAWIVTKESFDLSFLLQEGFSVTVPHDAVVTVNGKTLTEESITATDIPYESIKDFYSSYDLPTMTTYTVGSYIGQLETVVTDPLGQPLDLSADPKAFLDNCTDAEKLDLNDIVSSFITSYIHFTSQTGNDLNGNLQRLCSHVVPGGSLEKRMRDAARGLQWVTDRRVIIESIEINQYISIGNGRYICNVTYVVNTNYISGNIQSQSQLSLVIAQTDAGLKAEAMMSQ